MSTVKNADGWTVTFLDALDQPALEETFDTGVGWIIERNGRYLNLDGSKITPEYGEDGKVIWSSVVAVTQLASAWVGTEGTYKLNNTPLRGGEYSVKAFAVVDGVDQAVPATPVEVEP